MIAAIRKRLGFIGLVDWLVMGILLAFFAGAIIGSRVAHAASQQVNWLAWLDSFLQNSGTEMFGAFLTFLLIEVLRGSRREREAAEREIEELKQELIQKMGSEVRDVAVPAVEELRAHGWLTDGSLKGAHLREANLQEAKLDRAQLQETRLSWANLQGARLDRADLQGAFIYRANLQGVALIEANLQGAFLFMANLRGAVLWAANLQGADLQDALYDNETILPNGAKWTPDTDMARFTDPTHPDFWRSDDPDSPAYRGDDEEAPEA